MGNQSDDPRNFKIIAATMQRGRKAMKRIVMGICFVALAAMACSMPNTALANVDPSFPSVPASMVGAWEEGNPNGKGLVFYFTTKGTFHCFMHQNRVIQGHCEGTYQRTNDKLTMIANGKKIEYKLLPLPNGQVGLGNEATKTFTVIVKLPANVELTNSKGGKITLE